MVLGNAIEWTKRTLARVAIRSGEKVAIQNSEVSDMLAASRVTVPAADIFESETALQLLVDVPSATAATTHVAWDDVDTLSVHVRRTAEPAGEPWKCEYDESDWYRSLRLSAEVDGSKATCTVRDGVLRIVLPLRRTQAATCIPILAIDPA
jgi:HSP20 family molecular chaperone IbpA